METALNASASKMTPSPGNPGPLYEGDLINNIKFYYPEPEWDTPDFRMMSQNAEWVTSTASRFTGAYQRKGFMVAPVSTDWLGIYFVNRYKDKIIENSLAKMGKEFNEGFLTQQRMVDVLPPEIYQNDLIARNMELQKNAGERIRRHTVGENLALLLPAHKEGFIRNQASMHALTLGLNREDWCFEIFDYGPRLHLEVTDMFSYGPKSYSRLGALEQAVSVPMRYGHPFPLIHRKNINMNVRDIYGRPIGPRDELHEDVKALFDLVDNGLRAESTAALVLQRMMYDQWMLHGTGPINPDWAHPDVKAHYNDKKEVQAMKELTEATMDWMAENCDWPTLHAALENDVGESLSDFWDAHIAPRKDPNITTDKKADMDKNMREMLFSYLPRGGWEGHPVYASKIKTRRDKTKLSSKWRGPSPRATVGSHHNAFAPQYAPKMFNDDHRGGFMSLGRTDGKRAEIDPANMTVEQAAALGALYAQKEYLPPLEAPRTLLYLGDPKSGMRAAKWMHENGVADFTEPKDDLFSDAKKRRFSEVTADAAEDYEKAILRLLDNKPAHKEWRETYGIGNIVGLDFASNTIGELGKTREALNAERREAFAAPGGNRLSDVPSVINMRGIDHLYDGVILPAGPLTTETQYRYLVHALQAMLGQTERDYSGGQFRSRIFYDETNGREPPRELDLADIILLLTHNVSRDLDSPSPVGNRWAVLSAMRAMHILEMSPVIDVGRLNHTIKRDAFTGGERKSNIIDWTQVAAEHPELLAFINDEPEKLKAVRAIYDDLMLRDYSSIQADTGILPPVRGKLLVKGAGFLGLDDFEGLPERYRDAKKWHDNIGHKINWNTVNQNTLGITGPNIESA